MSYDSLLAEASANASIRGQLRRSKNTLRTEFSKNKRKGFADTGTQRAAESASISQFQGRDNRMARAGASPLDSGSSLYGDVGTVKANTALLDTSGDALAAKLSDIDKRLRSDNPTLSSGDGGSGEYSPPARSGGVDPGWNMYKRGAKLRKGSLPVSGGGGGSSEEDSPFNALPARRGSSSFTGGQWGHIVQDGRGGYKPYVRTTADQIMHKTPRAYGGAVRNADGTITPPPARRPMTAGGRNRF